MNQSNTISREHMANHLMTAAQKVLTKTFGYNEFRPGQEVVIEALLSERSALAVMPTGSGKSMCFQIPALVMGGLTIVISPLVALMQDQVSALKLSGVAAEGIHSGNRRAENVAAWRNAAEGRTRILYMSPERLMTERMLAALERLPIKLIAIDEAHCISQWGPAFRPEYADLCRLRQLFPDIPIVALTATADKITREDVLTKLFAGQAQQFVLGFDRPNISLAVELKSGWRQQLRHFIARRQGQSGIVYCLSRKKTEETAALLQADGIRALPYHAGMDKSERETHQNIFMTESGVVIVATIAFGMGIDKPDVRFVFHTDLPGSMEAYYQEIGRAGRDGLPARAHMLYGLEDMRMRRRFIEDEDSGPERKRREHKRLDMLISYCEAPSCRRVTLLEYFGEQHQPCNNCDICLSPPELIDGKLEALKILSAVYRSGERFGAAHVIDILCGKQSSKIVQHEHDALPTFGVGADRSQNEWRSLIRQMVATGLLWLDIGGYGGIQITDKGHLLLRGSGEFIYRKDRVDKARAAKKWKTDDQQTVRPSSALEQHLLTALKELRLDIAKKRGVPAFVVFHDRTLMDMARRRPRTKQEFATVSGVGSAKLRDFAEPFLAAIDRVLLNAGDHAEMDESRPW